MLNPYSIAAADTEAFRARVSEQAATLGLTFS
jgi:hypothetical protein